MTRRRWIADEVQGSTAALTGEHAAHLVRVLRAQAGQQFDIATGAGIRLGTITSISGDRVEFALGEVLAERAVPDIVLALAIFKFDRMEWAIEKCTELGVARIIPVVARRTDRHLAAAAVKRHERWQRLVQQAAEQSRRVGVPSIDEPRKLSDLTQADGLRIVLDETEAGTSLRDVLRPASSLMLAVGPEGGWADDELRWFRESGWVPATLGDTILRAETAAIVATAFAVEALRS